MLPLFADDIKLYMSKPYFNVLQKAVNLELRKIEHCLKANELFLKIRLNLCY